MKRSSVIRRRGMSLPEVMISSMLVGVLVVGSLKVVGGSVQTCRLNAGRLDGPKLAEELWSEIMAQPYEDADAPGGPLGLESGEAAPRSNFDDVDDYVGWSKSPPEDASGAALTAYNGWDREVFVARTNRDQGDDSAAADTGLKRFMVRVTSPTGKVYERQGLRWQQGALEEPPAMDLIVVTKLTSELQIGGQANAQTATTNLINHADIDTIANNAPTAVATGTPPSGTEVVNVSFDASGSSDPDGDPLTYEWDFGDGNTGSGVSPNHTYYNSGENTIYRTAILTVLDGKGGSSLDTVQITIYGDD